MTTDTKLGIAHNIVLHVLACIGAATLVVVATELVITMGLMQ